METLNDKLKSLGVSLGLNNLPESKPRVNNKSSQTGISQVLNGREINTPFGSVFIVENQYPINYHSRYLLEQPQELAAVIADTLNPFSPEKTRYVFLDTETSGLSGGSGTFAFLIGLGFFHPDHFELTQIFMRHPEEEEAVMAALGQILDEEFILVTFNGKTFDAPLLNTRHKMHGLTPLFSKETCAHIDMLPIARRIWKSRLPSRALGDLEREILGIVRTDEEVPGWMIPEMYFDYLSSGDAAPLARVFYHNAIDIVSLALLFIYTNQMLAHPLDYPVDSIDLASMAKIFESQGKIEQSIQIYEAALKQGLPVEFFIQTTMRYANIFKQNREWDSAVHLWEKAVEAGSLEAALELAKFYEHISKSIPDALNWTEKAVKINSAHFTTTWAGRLQAEELQKRMDRLKKKLP